MLYQGIVFRFPAVKGLVAKETFDQIMAVGCGDVEEASIGELQGELAQTKLGTEWGSCLCGLELLVGPPRGRSRFVCD